MSARTMVYGAVAGAAGTAVLDVTTYLDMLVRGRDPSDLPNKVVKEIVHRVRIQPFDKPDGELTHQDKNRETAFGALIGYADGLGTGALFGALGPLAKNIPWFWAGLGLGVLTMILSEGTATALEQTNPRRWSTGDWISDLAPRFLYGWVTALTFGKLAEDEQ